MRTYHRTRADAEVFAGTPQTGSTRKTLDDALQAALRRSEARGASGKHLRDLDRLRAILGPLAAVPVRDLTAEAYLAWDSRRKRGGASARVLVRVRAAMGEAVRQGWLDRDPLATVVFRRPDPGPVAVHTAREALRLLDAADGPLRLWLGLGYLAGLRPSEATALLWSQVEPGRLVVVSAKARSPRVRTVEVLPRLAALLADHGRGPVVACNPWTLYNLLERACRKARVRWTPDVARHTCASHLLALWRDSTRVALHLGHGSTAMLWRHYRASVPREDAVLLFGAG